MSVLAEGGALRHAARWRGWSRGAARRRAPARGAAILRDEDPVRFVHPLVRRVIAEQLTSVERDELHFAAARLLIEEQSPPERVAAHLLHGASAAAAGAWRPCARPRGRPGRAARTRRRSSTCAARVDEPPEPGLDVVLGELGAAEAMAHDPRAIEHLEQARRSRMTRTSGREIALELAAAHLDLFQSIEACRVIERALDELGPRRDLTRTHLRGGPASVAWLEAETVPSGMRCSASIGTTAGRPSRDARSSRRRRSSMLT